jgi:hypothetical protein
LCAMCRLQGQSAQTPQDTPRYQFGNHHRGCSTFECDTGIEQVETRSPRTRRESNPP